jgi:hypothetical protein
VAALVAGMGRVSEKLSSLQGPGSGYPGSLRSSPVSAQRALYPLSATLSDYEDILAPVDGGGDADGEDDPGRLAISLLEESIARDMRNIMERSRGNSQSSPTPSAFGHSAPPALGLLSEAEDPLSRILARSLEPVEARPPRAKRGEGLIMMSGCP